MDLVLSPMNVFPEKMFFFGTHLLFSQSVKSWCFQGSLLGGFPFPLCTTYTLKSPLSFKSWQSFICSPQYFKRFWIEKPKVWNPMIPTSFGAFPGSSCICHPILQGTLTGPEHREDSPSGQGSLAGGLRAAADPHTPPGRRRRCPNMIPTDEDVRIQGHRRDRWTT